MEAIFELLFEIFGEVLLQVVFEALAQAGVHVVRNPDKPAKVQNRWVLAAGYCLYGAIGGGVSLLISPQGLLHHPALRVGYLIIAPVAIGALLAAIARWRSKRGRPVLDIDRFGNGWLFAFTFAFIRFTFAH
jgi:hypothetical protein